MHATSDVRMKSVDLRTISLPLMFMEVHLLIAFRVENSACFFSLSQRANASTSVCTYATYAQNYHKEELKVRKVRSGDGECDTQPLVQ